MSSCGPRARGGFLLCMGLFSMFCAWARDRCRPRSQDQGLGILVALKLRLVPYSLMRPAGLARSEPRSVHDIGHIRSEPSGHQIVDPCAKRPRGTVAGTV